MTCSQHQGKRIPEELLSKIDPNTLLSDSNFESGIYNHVLVYSIPPRRVNTDLILSTRDTHIFGADFVDYGFKVNMAGRMSLLLHQAGGEMVSPIINRSHPFFAACR